MNRSVLRLRHAMPSAFKHANISTAAYNKAINFSEKFAKFTDHWSPRVIATLNDYEMKLVKIQGDFVWHKHGDTDEVFIVIEGEMRIDMQDTSDVILKAGEMCVVKRGDLHKPYAEKECKILLIETANVINTGDGNEYSSLTAANDKWI